MTTLFAEYTGNHPPLAIDWSLERKAASLLGIHASAGASRRIVVPLLEYLDRTFVTLRQGDKRTLR